MKVEAEGLKTCFEFVDNVPQNPGLAASQYLSLEAKAGKLRLGLSSLVSAQAEIPCDGDFKAYVDRRALGSFVGRATGKVTFEASQGKPVFVKSAGAKLELAPLDAPPSGYTEWKPGTGRKLTVETGLVSALSGYAKANPGEPHLEVVCFQKGFGSFATDTLVMAACLDKKTESDCMVPRFLAGLLAKTNCQEVWVEKNSVVIRRDKDWLLQPLPATEQSYPLAPSKGVLEKMSKQGKQLVVEHQDLIDGLRHLAGFAWAANGLDVVQCKLEAKGFQMRLDTPAVKADFLVPVTVTGKAVPATWAWGLNRMLPWLEYLGGLVGNPALELGTTEGLWWFRLTHESRMYLLVLAVSD